MCIKSQSCTGGDWSRSFLLWLLFQKPRAWWKKTNSWKKPRSARSAWMKMLMLYFCLVDICHVVITVRRPYETAQFVGHSFVELWEYFWHNSSVQDRLSLLPFLCHIPTNVLSYGKAFLNGAFPLFYYFAAVSLKASYALHSIRPSLLKPN